MESEIDLRSESGKTLPCKNSLSQQTGITVSDLAPRCKAILHNLSKTSLTNLGHKIQSDCAKQETTGLPADKNREGRLTRKWQKKAQVVRRGSFSLTIPIYKGRIAVKAVGSPENLLPELSMEFPVRKVLLSADVWNCFVNLPWIQCGPVLQSLRWGQTHPDNQRWETGFDYPPTFLNPCPGLGLELMHELYGQILQGWRDDLNTDEPGNHFERIGMTTGINVIINPVRKVTASCIAVFSLCNQRTGLCQQKVQNCALWLKFRVFKIMMWYLLKPASFCGFEYIFPLQWDDTWLGQTQIPAKWGQTQSLSPKGCFQPFVLRSAELWKKGDILCCCSVALLTARCACDVIADVTYLGVNPEGDPGHHDGQDGRDVRVDEENPDPPVQKHRRRQTRELSWEKNQHCMKHRHTDARLRPKSPRNYDTGVTHKWGAFLLGIRHFLNT